MSNKRDNVVGERLSEHLLDLIGGAGPPDMFPDPGEPGYREVSWTKTLGEAPIEQ